MDSTRRAVVVGLAGVAASLAGCVDGGSGPAEAETPTDDERDGTREGGEGNGTGDGPEDDTPEPPGESSYVLHVESVDEATVLDRLGVATLEDAPDEVRDPINTATAGRYETDTVPRPLLRFVAQEDLIQVDGALYELDARFPQEVLRLTAVDGGDVDSAAIVGADRFRRDPDAADAISTSIADGEARRAAYSPYLHDLVAEYDYVTPTEPTDEDADVYEWTLTEDDGNGPPYWLDAEERDRADVYGDAVVAFDSLSAAAQAEIERAIEDGEVTFEESPAVLDDDRSFRFVVIDGEHYSVAVSVSN